MADNQETAMSTNRRYIFNPKLHQNNVNGDWSFSRPIFRHKKWKMSLLVDQRRKNWCIIDWQTHKDAQFVQLRQFLHELSKNYQLQKHISPN